MTYKRNGKSCARTDHILHIIGGGLAGSEAAFQAACAGIPVILHEMRTDKNGGPTTPAHKTSYLAELVCSNSFRSDDAENNAVGLLHAEMRLLNSLIMREADKAALPAGGALAVDRENFSGSVSHALEQHPLIEVRREEITELPPESWKYVIVATGPLTSPPLAEAIGRLTGEAELAFFDAIAPVIYKETIDFKKAWMQSRYDKASSHPQSTGKDYINCPLNEEEYKSFIQALLDAPKTEFKEWEKNTPYFDGCMPIEEMAARGIDTPRFGPMKPVGLTDPLTGKRPYAVVQLRQDNALGTLYNMVGFQTKTTYARQKELFRRIPGLENAEFAKLGGLHRNTFINAPRLLDRSLRLKCCPRLRFAGQIAGCEGYVESAAIGLLAGRMAAYEILNTEKPAQEKPEFVPTPDPDNGQAEKQREERNALPRKGDRNRSEQTYVLPFQGQGLEPPPAASALGSLLNHITGGALSPSFQPTNINFGLFPEINLNSEQDRVYVPEALWRKKKLKGRDRKQAMSRRALAELSDWKARAEEFLFDVCDDAA